MFWYYGLIPDFATLRDRAEGPFRRTVYGLLALGWRGSGRHWHNYETAYLMLAGLATPLVVSVHTIVSFDFATSVIPGWHSTIFPPYFVTGAIFSGLSMVITLIVPLRVLCGLKDVVTTRHLENMCKLILATGLLLSYGYMLELANAWYGGNRLRAVRLHEPDDRPVRVVLLDDDRVQRARPPALLVPLVPDDALGDVRASRSWSTSGCGSSGS